MASNAGAYSGSLGGGFRLELIVNEGTLDAANNRSLVTVTAYMTCVTNEGHVYNLAATGGSVTVDGIGYSRSIGGYNFNGVGGAFYLMNGEQFWISHNTDGSRSLSVSTSHNADNSPYVTTAGTSLSMTLTTLQRYASISSFTITAITDTSFVINVTVSNTCDLLEYSLDNGTTYSSVSGDFTSTTVTKTGLPSGTSYNVLVRVRRKDSQLKTTSAATAVSTLPQNNFFGFF